MPGGKGKIPAEKGIQNERAGIPKKWVGSY
jgi:hypothetical protein